MDDNHGKFPGTHVIEPDTKQRKETRATLGGFDPVPEQLACFPTAVSRPLYGYLKPSELYRCPVDKGQVVYYCNQCAPSLLQPSNWKTVGCSYHYNAGALTVPSGGGFKEPPEDRANGLAEKNEGWVPSPDRYILLHEPSARLYGYNCVQALWYQWHFRRGPWIIEDPRLARQDFISPVLFVDGHVAQCNFSKSLSTDIYYPYEPTKDWIWYKPKPVQSTSRN